MTMDMSMVYWEKNPEWYKINEEADCYELTEKAPPEAVESFERWLEMNEQADKDRENGIHRW